MSVKYSPNGVVSFPSVDEVSNVLASGVEGYSKVFNVIGRRKIMFDGTLSATLIVDTFTDQSGTQLDAHTPDIDEVGGGWSLVGFFWSGNTPGAGDIEIQGNQVVFAPVDGIGAMIDIGETDFIFEFDWILGSGENRITCPIRGADKDNTIVLNCREFNADIRLESYVGGGSNGVFASTSYAFSDNETYRIRVEVSGNNYEIYVDDELELSGSTTDNNTGTFIGLGTAGLNVAQRFDNLEVRT